LRTRASVLADAGLRVRRDGFFLEAAVRRAVDAARRLAVFGRRPERLAREVVFAVFLFVARRPLLRLAISRSFRNLDSSPISVVLSVAYRKSASSVCAVGLLPALADHPLT
jgi:hypothetical protein